MSPDRGTTLKDAFTFSTTNWTDDATSLPLAYGFVYYLESGGSTYIRDAERVQNVTTALPLGG